jgi:hypothetical protein
MRFLNRSAALMAAVSLVGGVLAACPGIASATQANQAWAGTQAANGDWNYLGNTSGGNNFMGGIRNFNAGSGMCLDVPSWGFDPSGTQVDLHDCSTARGVWFQVDNHDGSWSYQMIGGASSVCLDSLQGHHYDGSPVEVFPCNGDNAQKWTIGPGGELQSVDSQGFCADATNWGTTDGTPIQLWQCT